MVMAVPFLTSSPPQAPLLLLLRPSASSRLGPPGRPCRRCLCCRAHASRGGGKSRLALARVADDGDAATTSVRDGKGRRVRDGSEGGDAPRTRSPRGEDLRGTKTPTVVAVEDL